MKPPPLREPDGFLCMPSRFRCRRIEIRLSGLHNPRLTLLAVLLIHGRPRSTFPGSFADSAFFLMEIVSEVESNVKALFKLGKTKPELGHRISQGGFLKANYS